ncbi:c-type cytochrome [Flavisolibacter sp. BT320]|nr:c-type cytochrome [Flavisolibacter longurius]
MMRTWIVVTFLCALTLCCASLTRQKPSLVYPSYLKTFEDTLRYLYSQPVDKWPKPHIDSGVVWTELGPIPASPLTEKLATLKDKIELGKTLFFDPRLSGSKQISCATCHVPDLSWADGREKSSGHDQQLNKRNSPTLLNVWFYKNLFWDGRSHSLEDQAFSPINSEIEMHSSMPDALRTLRRIEGYPALFQKAFGSPEISPETLTEALATFQRTLVSGAADFDDFLKGDTAALSEPALRGLHLFRTKARCMNCHNGPLLTDNSFHNIGLTNYGREHEDLGRYNMTHKEEDLGKFKTPSLRDVMRTRPWMHNGLFDNMTEIISLYNAGMPGPKREPGQENDPMFPKTDRLIKRLGLTRQERADIVAFLEAITAPPTKVPMPVLPGRGGR